MSRRHINQQSDWQQQWYTSLDDYHQRLGEGQADNNTVTNVTVQLGGSAFLHCRVRNMGERTVSPEVSITVILLSIGTILDQDGCRISLQPEAQVGSTPITELLTSYAMVPTLYTQKSVS